jgi:hypothetical protein
MMVYIKYYKSNDVFGNLEENEREGERKEMIISLPCLDVYIYIIL